MMKSILREWKGTKQLFATYSTGKGVLAIKSRAFQSTESVLIFIAAYCDLLLITCHVVITSLHPAIERRKEHRISYYIPRH